VGEAAPAIRFYFDYISSNAYLAWLELPKLAARHGAAIEPVPVLFAGLLGAHGQLGPAEVRPKAWWMARNNLRKAALLGVPLNPPRFHPWNPLLALRVSSLPLPNEERRALIDALFQGTWARSLHLSEPEVVAGIADEAGLPGAALVAEAQGEPAKQRLREQTDAAIAAGVFGVPTMGVAGELFWGYDDLPFLARYLAGEDPLDPKQVARWLGAGRSSAVRRRPGGVPMAAQVSIGVADLERARPFYDAALAVLGYARVAQSRHHAAYADAAGARSLAVEQRGGAAPGGSEGDGTRLCLRAGSRAEVDRFREAALGAGGLALAAPPARYHADVYAACVRDPEGHALEAVFAP
jgi:2-hydroxychromene-2-carboxylate isomerase/catechol 2,3-dioxygenase-like lactoylglutathione lyase family enzyme